MKRFIFILIALIATLTIGAQSIRLDNASFSNTYVVQQHVDVGVVFQTTFNNIYISQTFSPGVITSYYEVQPNNRPYTNNCLSNTFNTTQYRRGIGLINDYSNYNYIQTNNLINAEPYSQNNYKNIQRYYCYNNN